MVTDTCTQSRSRYTQAQPPDPRTHHNADVHAQALLGTVGHTAPCTLQNTDAHVHARTEPATQTHAHTRRTHTL